MSLSLEQLASAVRAEGYAVTVYPRTEGRFVNSRHIPGMEQCVSVKQPGMWGTWGAETYDGSKRLLRSILRDRVT